MSFRTGDFKSPASAIPPLAHNALRQSTIFSHTKLIDSTSITANSIRRRTIAKGGCKTARPNKFWLANENNVMAEKLPKKLLGKAKNNRTAK